MVAILGLIALFISGFTVPIGGLMLLVALIKKSPGLKKTGLKMLLVGGLLILVGGTLCSLSF